MESDKDKLSERFVPYLEGVLNPAEAEEVEELLRADSRAAEELAGIEEAIGSLRAAYRVAGHSLPEAVVTPDELLRLVYQADELSPAERKALRLKLADSPSAQKEAVLLRELDQEMARSEAAEAATPAPMPDALKKAFLANHGAQPKQERSAGWWSRWLAALGTLNPKPFVAVATCLVALCVGMAYTSKNRPLAEPGVATMTRPSTEAEAPEPLTFGVRVSDSENPEELRKQARQLLDHKVKYAVKGEGLYVTSDEETRAREALEQLKSPPAEAAAETEEPQAKEVAVVVPERYKSRAKMAREEQLADLDAPEEKDAELLPAVDYTRRRRVVAGQMDDGLLEGGEEEDALEKLPEPVVKPRVQAAKRVTEAPAVRQDKVAAAAPAASQPEADQFANERDQAGKTVSALKPKKSVESEVRRDEPADERAKGQAGYQARRETAQAPASEVASGTVGGETNSAGASYHANAPRSAPVASAKPNVVSNIGVEDSLGAPGARAAGRQSGAGATPQVAVVDPVTSLERDFGVTIQVQSRPGGGRIITVTANQSLADDQVEAMRDRLNTALKVSELDSIVIHHLEP